MIHIRRAALRHHGTDVVLRRVRRHVQPSESPDSSGPCTMVPIAAGQRQFWRIVNSPAGYTPTCRSRRATGDRRARWNASCLSRSSSRDVRHEPRPRASGRAARSHSHRTEWPNQCEAEDEVFRYRSRRRPQSGYGAGELVDVKAGGIRDSHVSRKSWPILPPRWRLVVRSGRKTLINWLRRCNHISRIGAFPSAVATLRISGRKLQHWR